MDDVVLNKASIIERCLRRVDEEYGGDDARLDDQTRQDAIVLNLQRACQAAIDIAMHVAARDHLGVPQSSGDAFELLERAGVIDAELSRSMRAMVGFRNVAIHEYQALDPAILRRVIERAPTDFGRLCGAVGIRIEP